MRTSQATLKRILVTGLLVPLAAASYAQDAGRGLERRAETREYTHRERVEAQGIAQQVAQGIALALADKDLRAELRDAMRESPLKEHKLVLQDFAGSEAGRRLIDEAAAGLGRSSEELSSVVAALPALDFYVAYREHRKTWKATPEVLVAATFDSRAPRLMAYDVTGNSHELLLADGIPAVPLIILHPAETKFRRPAERAHSGEVIEGQPRRQPAPVAAEKSSGYHLYHYNIQQGDGWYGGDCEMEFRSHFRGNDGLRYGFNTLAFGGVNEDQGYDVNLHLNGPSITGVFVLELFEMDGGSASFNQEDWYGTRQYALSPGTSAGILPFYENTYIPFDPISGDRSAWIGIRHL